MWEAYYVAHDFGLMLFDGVGVCSYKVLVSALGLGMYITVRGDGGFNSPCNYCIVLFYIHVCSISLFSGNLSAPSHQYRCPPTLGR